MPAITPQFMMDLESRMQLVTENEYSRLTQNLWWQNIARVRETQAGKEIIAWLLSTAQIKDEGKGGNIRFDDLVSQYTTVEPNFSGAGLQLKRAQFEDTDGNGLNLAAEWSGQIGAQMAYWPQKQTAYFLKNGHNATLFTGYDGKAFFATDHPLNPFRPSVGTYANLFTGAAAGSYPGAIRIDEGITADLALTNLQKLYGYIAGIKMPNGEDPRGLRPRFILAPPALMFRLTLLTQAKFIAQAATGGGAAVADVQALIAALGLALPIQADELAGWENDTTFFVACEQISASQIGAMIYLNRESYKINYYGPQTDAELSRRQELEWHCIGRNGIGPGLPYLLFKCKAA